MKMLQFLFMCFVLGIGPVAGSLSEEVKVHADPPNTGDEFGDSVSISGNSFLVGAHSFDNGDIQQARAAYVQ